MQERICTYLCVNQDALDEDKLDVYALAGYIIRVIFL